MKVALCLDLQLNRLDKNIFSITWRLGFPFFQNYLPTWILEKTGKITQDLNSWFKIC